MITRKAAVGFILLAIIVFSISSYDTAHPVNTPPKDINPKLHNISLKDTGIKDIKTVRNDTIIYRSARLDFGNANPYIMTALIEIFALGCYVAAKRIEPAVIAWEREERERVRQEWLDEHSDEFEETEETEEPEGSEEPEEPTD